MRKQRSPCTLSSYDNLSEWQVSMTTDSCNYETESYPGTAWPQCLTCCDPHPLPYQDLHYTYDYNAAGDMSPQNFYLHDADYSQATVDGSYATYDNSWNPPTEYFLSGGQSVDDSYAFPAEDGVLQQCLPEEPFHQLSFLKYGVPTVTCYGTVALLLRHLVRVDLTADGSVSVYNFPASSVTTLNAAGDKCYLTHPNGRVFQEGSSVHMVAGKDRFVKISRRGVTFSSAIQSLAYVVDESGTKTTTGKFTDLSQDLTLHVFYDGNQQSLGDLEQESYRTVSEAIYQNCLDGSEMWTLGGIRVVQDRWGQVVVTQTGSEASITTSPTIRKVTVDSTLANISVGCFSRNYMTVRRGSCLVTSGYCGLIVQNRCQKAGLDRSGKLVLF